MSMEVLGIGINVDPADSAAKADAVTASLHKSEDAGIAAGKAMLGLAGNFKSLAAALQQHQAALERNAASHAHLNSATHAAAGAFGKMAEAIQREKSMLEQIHGPTKRYADDLQTLDSLLRRNAISTSEYAAQVTRLNREIDGAPKHANMPSAAPATGPNLGALRGAAAAVGISVGISELTGLADSYTQIQNRLRLMAPDQEQANKLFGQLSGVASRSRSELGATVDAYAGMSRATKQLGLSQDETLRATETLSKLVTVSGKSASESAAGLMQFSQALSSGRLQGDELRSVFENMPSLVDALQSSLGKTQAELREMGSAGQITGRVMVDALLQASSTADASLGKSIPTLSQSMVLFKNEMLVTFGELNHSLGITDALGSAMTALGIAVKVLVAPLQLLGSALDAVGISGGTATKVIGTTVGATLLLGGPVGVVAGATVALIAGASALGDWQHEANEARLLAERFAVAQQKLNDSVTQGGAAFQQAQKELMELNLLTMAGADAANSFARAWAKADEAARAPEFRKLFMDPDGIDQFRGMANGRFKRNAVDDLHAFLANGSKPYDVAGGRASELIAEREKAVQAAQKELAGLERQWASYQHGGTTLALYRQERERLLAVINGTVAASQKDANAAKKQREEYEKLGKALLGVESVSARAIRIGAGNRAGDQAEISFVAELDHKTSFDGAARYRAEVEQINWLHHQGMVDADLYARGIDDINKRYNDAAGLTDLLNGKTNAYEQSIDKLRASLALGAITAAQFNDAAKKAWMGSDEYKAQEDAAKQIEEAQKKIADQAEEQSRRVQEAWANGLGSIAGSFVQMAAAGELSFGKLLHQATQLAIQMAAMQMGGSGGAFLSSFAGALGGFAGGGSFRVGNDSDRWVLPRAANGNRWTVGGSGGVDSKIAMFRVTPGEQVNVHTPAQVATGGGGITREMFGMLLAALDRNASPMVVVTDGPRGGGYEGARRAELDDRRRGRAMR